MKIKKFKARNFTEALSLVKKELSEDAIILSTEEKKGLRPFVEVTAAVDYEINEKRCNGFPVRKSRKRMTGVKRQKGDTEGSDLGNAGVTACNGHPSVSNDSRYFRCTFTDEIKKEIGNLREMITDMKNNGYEMSLPSKKKMIFHFLRERAVREEFALRLCEHARDLNDIPSLLSADMRVMEQRVLDGIFTKESARQKKAIMFIGPTGVGKTTTIAKLAAHAIGNRKSAAIINLDAYRIGAVEQMRIYAKIMGIPFCIASDIKELKENLLNFAKSRDIIFIDTSGRNPRDELYINELLEISQIEFPFECHLLMGANCDDDFMIEAYRFYRRLPVDYISFTKIDEAVRFGTLYNLQLIYQKPVAYMTTGQKVPDDIEFATVSKLTNLILKKGWNAC
ncbi:MAG: flagellar biosynthesis protein FlhF [Nitrospirota bacterium]